MSVVRGFETAFNRQDVDALLACFTERASYRDNFYREHAGKDIQKGNVALGELGDRAVTSGTQRPVELTVGKTHRYPDIGSESGCTGNFERRDLRVSGSVRDNPPEAPVNDPLAVAAFQQHARAVA